MTITKITICERGDTERIIGEEIKRAFRIYPDGFEMSVNIKSEVPGVYGLPGYVDLKLVSRPTLRAVDDGQAVAKSGQESLPIATNA